MKGRYEIIKTILRGNWSEVLALRTADERAEHFIDASGIDVEPFRLFLEENIKSGREIELSRIRLAVDPGASYLRCMLIASLARKADETVVSFFPFREVGFQNLEGSVSTEIQRTDRPLLTLAFPDGNDAINVKSPENIRDRSLVFDVRINQLLRQNESFRNIFCNLLTGLGEKHGILKDIAGTVREDHCFMIPGSVDEFLCCEDADSFIDRLNWAGVSTVPGLTMNQAYYLVRIALFIQDADWGLLSSYCGTHKNYYCENDLADGSPNLTRFLTDYVLSRKPSRDRAKLISQIKDYINTCNEEGELISLQLVEEL